MELRLSQIKKRTSVRCNWFSSEGQKLKIASKSHQFHQLNKQIKATFFL